jgi:hypothetical protein
MGMEKFRAPPLPNPTSIIDNQYIRQLLRALELYFDQLDSKTPRIAESFRADKFFGGEFFGDGYGVKLPHVAASDSTDQVATGNNTATVVKWDTLESGYEWELNAPGSATAQFGGVYKITYSLQFINTSNAIHFATAWLKVNGSDVANSATKFFIPARKSNSAGEEGYTVGYSEATFTIHAGDEVELYWATDLAGNPTTPTTGVYIFHDAAQTTPFARPAIPSAIGSITFVSALP